MTRKRPGRPAFPQPTCSVCGTAPVAMRATSFCFACWPGGPVTPPPCLRCGARTGYFTDGVCRRCHINADAGIDSCLDCHAWGATRTWRWLCRGCWTWRRNNPTIGPCTACGRDRHLGHRGACRLCFTHACSLREPDGKLEIVAANRHGQQLCLIDNAWQRANSRAPKIPAAPRPPLEPVRHEQMVLFPARRDLAAHGRTGLILRADPHRAAELDQRARTMAAQHGWSKRRTEDTSLALRIVLGIQDSPNAPINASDVTLLRSIDLPMWTVMKVLSEAGILHEDRTPAFDTWFAEQIDGLPEQMAAELHIWLEVMKNGSPVPPRRRPRTQITIGSHLRWALPALRVWAAAGHTSLRQITRQHLLDVLPGSGNARSTMGQGVKSIFRLLRAHKVLFTNPTARLKTGGHESKQPLPADIDAIRAALDSTKPAQAAVVALIAFHGLRKAHLRRLLLTDISDGRLHIDGGRSILLAAAVRTRLSTYLDYRNQRWPNTANPHLFVHYRSALRTAPNQSVPTG